MIDPCFAEARLDYTHNDQAQCDVPWPSTLDTILSPEAIDNAIGKISQWPGYAPTPLIGLKPLAKELGIAAIDYKDEGNRFGLGSFKALGGAYAVGCLVDRLAGEKNAADITVVTATDGNHGRSVAWGARRAGCKCRIYIHAEVSENRKRAMEDLGATVVRIAGNYDASVHQAARDAENNGWYVVSDTSWEGYRQVPADVMAGYGVMAHEIITELEDRGSPPPSHVFVQGGVGGLAAAVLAPFWQHYGVERPRFVIVEPDRAPCLFASARAGHPTPVTIEDETVMAGLSCGEVSEIAWEILALGASDFLTIKDGLVGPAMRALGHAQWSKTPIIAGESAVAGLAGLVAGFPKPSIRDSLGLGSESRILAIGSEGATDPAIYERLVPGILT